MEPGRVTRSTNRLRELASVAVVVAFVALLVVALVAPAASRLRPILPAAEPVEEGKTPSEAAVDVEVQPGRWAPKPTGSLSLAAAPPASTPQRRNTAGALEAGTSAAGAAGVAPVELAAVADAVAAPVTPVAVPVAAPVAAPDVVTGASSSVTSLNAFATPPRAKATIGGRPHRSASAEKAIAKARDRKSAANAARDLTRGSSTVDGHDDGGERGAGRAPGMAEEQPSRGVGQGHRGR